jgi:hypothetical protein
MGLGLGFEQGFALAKQTLYCLPHLQPIMVHSLEAASMQMTFSPNGKNLRNCSAAFKLSDTPLLPSQGSLHFLQKQIFK